MATKDYPSRNSVSVVIAIRKESLATCLSFYRAALGERSLNSSVIPTCVRIARRN